MFVAFPSYVCSSSEDFAIDILNFVNMEAHFYHHTIVFPLSVYIKLLHYLYNITFVLIIYFRNKGAQMFQISRNHLKIVGAPEECYEARSALRIHKSLAPPYKI